MKKLLLKRKSGGYTIIETMIAISLFIIIVMAGMGALLNANLLSQKSKDMRSIIDNLSFVMEDMSRNLRTGYSYYCITGDQIPTGEPSPSNCENGGGISFKSTNPDSQWVYYTGTNPNDSAKYSIFKSVGGGTAVQLTPNEVKITSSSFTVSGADTGNGDKTQPFVTIELSGEIDYKDVKSPFSLQTSVSQRAIDF